MHYKKKNELLNNLNKLQSYGFKYMDKIDFKSFESTDLYKGGFVLPDNIKMLKDIVKSCSLCQFSKSKTNILFGEGNENTSIMFLTISPTSIEDESGILTNDRNGQILKDIASNILLMDISQIYVAPILKCLPSKSLNDSSNEFQICKSYIQKQIDIISPKVIVVFGDGYKYLTSKENSFEKCIGVVQNFNGIKVMQTYDTTYILRNPSCKKDVLQHMKQVKVYLENQFEF
jgi:DNA polymerase